ncbi:MAG: hypothetical protein WBC91_17980 [Phototrophicaceae bacterium]
MNILSGRAMCRHLMSLGVTAQKVVRKRETGDYVADFYIPDMDDSIAPASQWAQAIRHVLPDVHIIETHDTVASWRQNQPIIHATVVFQV